MIEETIEMDPIEESFDSEEGVVPVEDDDSILPAVGLVAAGVAGATALVVAAVKTDFPGRVKHMFKAAGKAFKEYEAPKKESDSKESDYIEVEAVEVPAE